MGTHKLLPPETNKQFCSCPAADVTNKGVIPCFTSQHNFYKTLILVVLVIAFIAISQKKKRLCLLLCSKTNTSCFSAFPLNDSWAKLVPGEVGGWAVTSDLKAWLALRSGVLIPHSEAQANAGWLADLPHTNCQHWSKYIIKRNSCSFNHCGKEFWLLNFFNYFQFININVYAHWPL